jgi:hypothetical protein
MSSRSLSGGEHQLRDQRCCLFLHRRNRVRVGVEPDRGVGIASWSNFARAHRVEVTLRWQHVGNVAPCGVFQRRAWLTDRSINARWLLDHSPAACASLSSKASMKAFWSSTMGPDFLDTTSGELHQLTTPGQVASLMMKPGPSQARGQGRVRLAAQACVSSARRGSAGFPGCRSSWQRCAARRG